MNNPVNFSSQKGLSLLELVVSIAVAGFILTFAVTAFLSLKQSYHLHTQLATIQENARFALTTLATSLRRAGFGRHCSAFSAVKSAVVGGDPFATMTINTTDINACTEFTGQLSVTRFYPAPSVFDQTVSLFMHVSGWSSPEELVSGVDDMQILYGIDTDASANGQVNHYRSGGDILADQASAATAWVGWDRVVSVQIAMVLRSQHAMLPAPVAQRWLGVDYHDRYLRQQFATTVYLRNALP